MECPNCDSEQVELKEFALAHTEAGSEYWWVCQSCGHEVEFERMEC